MVCFFFEPAALSSLSWIRYLSQMSHFGLGVKSVFFDFFQAWGPKASQRASKGIPKGVQRHPKGSPKEAKELQDVPKGGQGAPKDTPRRSKGTQRRPKADPRVAKWPKEWPKEIQEVPKLAQRDPRRAKRLPKARHTKEVPKRFHTHNQIN